MSKNSITKFKKLLPDQITVITQKSEDGFFAEIKELPNCYTQADSLSELIEMVNDAVFTYLDVPDDIRDQLGTVYLPEELRNEIMRIKIQEACRELTKTLEPSELLYKKTVITE